MKVLKADKDFKKQIILLLIGVVLFLLSFFSTVFLAVYLADLGILSGYGFEIYGLFGTIIFMASIVFLIVKFKTFDVKLIATQALVWSVVILVGSQFFFIQNPVNKILNSITFLISSVLGLIIVRGVKREINLREDLQVANKGQENLIHIMNHQVKGFFGIAKNIFAELLQSDDYGHMPDASKPLLEKGFETTNAGVSYVQDILRGASAEKGVLPYDMKLMNIKDVVSTLLSEQKDIAIKKGLSFESNIEDGDFNMIGDAVQLKEALKNLITNAIRYNDYSIPNGGINIDLKRKGDKIIFLVKDTGVGIAEEDKPRLFTAGGRGKNSIKINVESSGYGLAFVKDVAEKHKGTVGYKPNKTGRGTTFFMELSAKMDGGMIISSAN
ncbi:MAG: HAMP domain-containing sensor histidine kinase, partial [bacterium]